MFQCALFRYGFAHRMIRSRCVTRWLPIAGLVGIFGGSVVQGAIFGTLSNFDTFNQTPEPSEGAEIELEGVHSADVYNTYPSHYNIKNITEYSSGGTFGTRITFEDYYFVDSSSVVHTAINPNPSPPNTNGHYAVNLPDCEHFGFAVTTQPTSTRFFWLNKLGDGSYVRIDPTPVAIPSPTWTYQPPAGGAAPIVVAAVQVPKPEVEVQLPDSIWMKVFVTELDRVVDLDELMSGPGGIVPQEAAEVETEWELLEGGVLSEAGGELGDPNAEAVIRRYEFYKYTGLYDAESHEPLSTWTGVGDPPVNELGNFIAANMAAVNLAELPEPSTLLLLAGGALMLARRRI